MRFKQKVLLFGIFASFAFALITGITTTASAASVDVNAFVNLTITPTNKETKYASVDVELYEATNGGSLGITKAGTPSYTGQVQGDTAEANSTVANLGGNTAFTGVADGTYVLCVKGSAEICSNLVTIDENTENPLGIQVDVKDPATSAQFEEGFYEQLQAQQAQQGTTNTCGGMVSGMGWIICPVINGITMLNDFMWGLATILLKVNPLMQSDPVYEAWGIIRNIANVAFVIAFLIIIFSQLTGAGISNYGVKKLLPRLLICAVLVNISFVLMQLAVDVANILGAGLFDLLTSITPNVQGATWGMLFKNIVGLGSIGALSALGVTLAGGPAAALWMLGPIVIMGALGFLAALLTLIFRQAVIPVLAVMAPLAFVAYLLPNTESWFKKWSSLFMSMLMLYPIAGIVFGGARFVSAVVMGDNSEWFKHMIGLIILTLPLFSLPYLASKGGALMTAVGGKLNGLAEKARNPVNSWAKGHEDEARAQYLATDGAFGARNRLGRYMQGHARNFAARRKTREANTKTYGTQFQNMWANTDHGMGAIDLGREADDILAETMEKAGNRYITSAAGIAATDALAKEKKRTTINQNKATSRQDNSTEGKDLNFEIGKTNLQNEIDKNRAEEYLESNAPDLTLRAKATKLQLDAAKAMTNQIATEATTDSNAWHLRAMDATDRAMFQNSQRTLDIANSATSSAQRIQQGEYQTELAKGGVTAYDAGGIDIDHGTERAMVGAMNALEKTRQENVSVAGSLFTTQGYSTAEMTKVATEGILRDGTAASLEQRIAAAKKAINIGFPDEVKAIINHAAANHGQLEEEIEAGLPETEEQKNNKLFQQAIGAELAQKRPKWVSGSQVGKFNQGMSTETTDQMIVKTMLDGNYSSATIAAMHPVEVQNWADVLGNPDSINLLMPTDPDPAIQAEKQAKFKEKFEQARNKLWDSIHKANDDPRISGSMDDGTKEQLDNLLKALADEPHERRTT